MKPEVTVNLDEATTVLSHVDAATLSDVLIEWTIITEHGRVGIGHEVCRTALPLGGYSLLDAVLNAVLHECPPCETCGEQP